MGFLKNIGEVCKQTFLDNDFAKGFKSGFGLDKDPQKEIAENTAKILKLQQKQIDEMTK